MDKEERKLNDLNKAKDKLILAHSGFGNIIESLIDDRPLEALRRARNLQEEMDEAVEEIQTGGN